MSIATDKARLDAAKADLKTFLEDNGVSVPTGTKIDGMVGMLADVETGGGAEPATITITGEETSQIMYVDKNGLLQYVACSPGTILQSIVGSVIAVSWDVSAIRKQVTGLDMRLTLITSHFDSEPEPFSGFRDLNTGDWYCGVIQNSEVTIYAETD